MKLLLLPLVGWAFLVAPEALAEEPGPVATAGEGAADAAPRLEGDRSPSHTLLDAATLDALPLARTVEQDAVLAGHVIRTEPFELSFAGGPWSANRYFLDGVEVGDILSTLLTRELPYEMFDFLDVRPAARGAPVPSTVGGVIYLRTRRPESQPHLRASIYAAPHQLQSLDEKGGREQISTLRAAMTSSGRLLGGKLGYAAGLELPFGRVVPDGTPSDVFPDLGRDERSVQVNFGLAGLGKLEWYAAPTQTISLLIAGAGQRAENVKQGLAVHPDAQRRATARDLLVALSSVSSFSSGVTWSNSLSFVHQRWSLEPQSGDLDTPGRVNTGTGTDTVNDTLYEVVRGNRAQLSSRADWRLDNLFGSHRFAIGLDASVSWSGGYESIPGQTYFIDYGVDPNDPESISGVGLPDEQVRLIEAGDSRAMNDSVALYVEDRWQPIPGLTVTPGLRVDSDRGLDSDGRVVLERNVPTPRLRVTWEPWADERTVIEAGYYQYADAAPLYLSYLVGARSKHTRAYHYNPITGEYDILRNDVGGESGYSAAGYLSEPFDQRRPRAHDFVVGLRREVAPNVELSGSLVHRRTKRLWAEEEVNVQWNEAGDSAVGFVNGEAEYLWQVTAPEKSEIEHWGASLRLRRRLAEGWFAMASYTWTKTEGTFENYLASFDRPRQLEFLDGPLRQDRRHTVQVSASFTSRIGLETAIHIAHQSGGPYSRFVFNSFYGDYSDRGAPRGYDLTEDGEEVELRLPAVFTVDLRLAWDLRPATGVGLQLTADIFNLFNDRAATAVEQRDLPAGGRLEFEDPIAWQAPRYVRVGLRWNY